MELLILFMVQVIATAVIVTVVALFIEWLV
jgi:hypothetical protein